jgi:uncharacterized membrane protein YdjX (TVP38/TMEM64 family)
VVPQPGDPGAQDPRLMDRSPDSAPKENGHPDAAAAEPSGRLRDGLRIALVVAVLGALIVALRASPLGELFSSVDSFRRAIDASGLWPPLAFCGLAAVLVCVGAPRLVFAAFAGALFGFAEGLLLCQISTLAGALGTFLLARWGLGSLLRKRRWAAVEKIRGYLDSPTILDVFLLRQLPVWGLLTTAVLGSGGTRTDVFLAGSFLGFLPQSVVFSLVGAGVAEESAMITASRVVGAISVIAISALATLRLRRARELRLGADRQEGKE